MTSASTTSPRSAGWIIAPVWDVLYLVGTPLLIVPAVLLLVQRYVTPEQLSLVVIAFASMGHHLPGFMRAYGDRELFARFRWRFLLMPPLVLLVALLYSPPPSLAGYLGIPWRHLQGLELMLVLWGTWHGLMQTYGFMRIYDMKRGARDRLSAGLDFWLCLMLFAAGFVFSDARMYQTVGVAWQIGAPIVGPEWLAAMRFAVGLATTAVIAAYVTNLLYRGFRGLPFSRTKTALAAITGLFYWYTGTLAVNILVGIAMFEIFHAVQYFAIVWVFNRRRAKHGGRPFGWLGFLFRDRWTMLGLYLALIAAFGFCRFLIGDASGRSAILSSADMRMLLFALFTTSTFLHFYYDGFIWKVSESRTSANLDIQSAGGPERFVPVLVHGAKLAAFFGIAAGLMFLELRRSQTTAEAQKEVNAALAAWMPDLPESLRYGVYDALEQGDRQSAYERAKRATALRPRSHEMRGEFGAVLLKMERYEDARRELSAAVSLAPRVARHRINLALACERLEDFDSAAKWYREALALEPGSLVAAIGRARVWMQQGQADKANSELERVVERSADAVDAWYQLGLARLALGEFSAARDALEVVVRLDPEHAQAYFHLGGVLARTGELELAARAYRRTIELAPQQIDAYANLGGVLFQQALPKSAERIYRLALERAPNHAPTHYNLGLLLASEGRIKEARGHIKRARELGSTLPTDVAASFGIQ